MGVEEEERRFSSLAKSPPKSRVKITLLSGAARPYPSPSHSLPSRRPRISSLGYIIGFLFHVFIPEADPNPRERRATFPSTG